MSNHRHPYQVGRSAATVETALATGAWVREDWFELDRQENKQPCYTWHGPFDTVEEAQAYADALVAR